jgi:DNA-binding transcriptional ArsR family regulator
MGRARRTEIAAALGRPPTAIAHPLAVLEDIGLLERVEDAFRSRRGVYRIADPLIRLNQLVIQRAEGRLIRREGPRVWHEAADTVAAKIYGPHLEDLAREWALAHAAEETLGGRASWIRPATLPCRAHRNGHELDLVAVASMPDEADRMLAIGEVKATTRPVDLPAVERLEHLRTLLPPDRVGTQPKLLLVARQGFTDRLIELAAKRPDLELVDIQRLYHRSPAVEVANQCGLGFRSAAPAGFLSVFAVVWLGRAGLLGGGKRDRGCSGRRLRSADRMVLSLVQGLATSPGSKEPQGAAAGLGSPGLVMAGLG